MQDAKLPPPESGEVQPSPRGFDRRSFLTRAGAAATLAAGAATIPTSAVADDGPSGAGFSNERIRKTFEVRSKAALHEALIPSAPQTTNGDEQRYPDKSGTYSKGLLQDGYGRVNLQAFKTMKTALKTGRPSDFEKIIIGGKRKQNGPQGALALGLEGSDGVQFGNAPCPANQETITVVPPAPAVASAAYGTELIELYWCSLLRDVAFTDYSSNAVAAAATQELSAQPSYAGPRDSHGNVTPELLFRGAFPGEGIGPYISQLFITPTAMGAQEMDQRMTTYLPGIDYMTDLTSWQDVQSGISTGLSNQVDPQPRFLKDGRGLAAYTHVDVLYQAYFTALLVMSTLGVPLNPGNPYVKSKTQNGFSTFGAPDFAASIGELAARSLDVVWYHKWLVHLRHRPESGGGLVHLIETGHGNTIDAKLHANVLNSQAVQQSFSQYGTYLLSQCYPEGSPTHPAYPTGHGMVAGACITILKFFFDGSWVFPNPLVPTNDGLSLEPYTGSDAGQITLNGELHKIAHNVSFGHGIHSGVHWRSDSDVSIQLGEAFAISVLQDRARTYNEKFTVSFTKLDGTTATISNQ